MTKPSLKDVMSESPLDDHIEPFLKHLRGAGYAERTLRKKRTVARAFARWIRRKQIAVDDLNDDHIAAFAGAPVIMPTSRPPKIRDPSR